MPLLPYLPAGETHPASAVQLQRGQGEEGEEKVLRAAPLRALNFLPQSDRQVEEKHVRVQADDEHQPRLRARESQASSHALPPPPHLQRRNLLVLWKDASSSLRILRVGAESIQIVHEVS